MGTTYLGRIVDLHEVVDARLLEFFLRSLLCVAVVVQSARDHRHEDDLIEVIDSLHGWTPRCALHDC